MLRGTWDLNSSETSCVDSPVHGPEAGFAKVNEQRRVEPLETAALIVDRLYRIAGRYYCQLVTVNTSPFAVGCGRRTCMREAALALTAGR